MFEIVLQANDRFAQQTLSKHWRLKRSEGVNVSYQLQRTWSHGMWIECFCMMVT